MTVPVTAVKLVGRLAGSIVAIHRQLPGPKAFLSPIELGAKLGEVVTHPGQPLVHRAPGLGRLQLVSRGGDPGGEQTHGHGSTQSPQAQGIGVVADHSLHGSGSLTVLALADLGVAFLGMAVEDYGGPTSQVIFQELVQVFGVKTGEV